MSKHYTFGHVTMQDLL